MLTVKRIYDAKGKDGSFRVLTDRLWPRGVSKEDAALDLWAKDVTPSAELRRRYHDGQISYETFADAYRDELAAGEAVRDLAEMLRTKEEPVTLLTAVKDVAHSHMPVLRDKLEALGLSMAPSSEDSA